MDETLYSKYSHGRPPLPQNQAIANAMLQSMQQVRDAIPERLQREGGPTEPLGG